MNEAENRKRQIGMLHTTAFHLREAESSLSPCVKGMRQSYAKMDAKAAADKISAAARLVADAIGQLAEKQE